MSKYLKSYFGKKLDRDRTDQATGLEIFYKFLVVSAFLYFLLCSLSGCTSEEKALGNVFKYDTKWPTMIPGYCDRHYPCEVMPSTTELDTSSTTQTIYGTSSKPLDISKWSMTTIDNGEKYYYFNQKYYDSLLALIGRTEVTTITNTITRTITKPVLDTRGREYFRAVADSFKNALIKADSDAKVLQSKITTKNKWITYESIALGLIVVFAIAGMCLKIKL